VLAAIGKLVSDSSKIFSLLRGLGKKYESFVTSRLNPPVPSYADIVPLLQGHETMRKWHGSKESGFSNQNAFVGQIFQRQKAAPSKRLLGW